MTNHRGTRGLGLKFRLARVADWKPLLRLIEVYYGFDSIAFDERITGRALRRLLRDKSLGRAWVIDAGHYLAGYAILTYNYDLEFGGLEGLVTDLFIVERHRGKGLGASLMDAIGKFCCSNGIGTIELQVTRDNHAAVAFYRALGFKALDRIVMSFEPRPSDNSVKK